jgi:hypothetical protein
VAESFAISNAKKIFGFNPIAVLTILIAGKPRLVGAPEVQHLV